MFHGLGQVVKRYSGNLPKAILRADKWWEGGSPDNNLGLFSEMMFQKLAFFESLLRLLY